MRKINTNPNSSSLMPDGLNHEKFIEQTVRVNQAGEYGAVRIYQGQLRAIKDSSTKATIEHMAMQEQKHLEYFDTELVARKIRPTLLHPLWHFGGFMLGYITAKMGKEEAMICTQAVEEVIDAHYQEQLKRLDKREEILKKQIEVFRQEELEHKETAESFVTTDSLKKQILSDFIKTTCKMAIWLSKRI